MRGGGGGMINLKHGGPIRDQGMLDLMKNACRGMSGVLRMREPGERTYHDESE